MRIRQARLINSHRQGFMGGKEAKTRLEQGFNLGSVFLSHTHAHCLSQCFSLFHDLFRGNSPCWVSSGHLSITEGVHGHMDATRGWKNSARDCGTIPNDNYALGIVNLKEMSRRCCNGCDRVVGHWESHISAQVILITPLFKHSDISQQAPVHI